MSLAFLLTIVSDEDIVFRLANSLVLPHANIYRQVAGPGIISEAVKTKDVKKVFA
jgi:hypothetical protein